MPLIEGRLSSAFLHLPETAPSTSVGKPSSCADFLILAWYCALSWVAPAALWLRPEQGKCKTAPLARGAIQDCGGLRAVSVVPIEFCVFQKTASGRELSLSLEPAFQSPPSSYEEP